MESKAMDFIAMDFSAQESIINACLVNSAKLINSMQKESTNYSEYKTYRDCVAFLFANHDEIFNDSWINCMDMASNEKYTDMPLALFVSKASGKALRKAFYWNSKSASEKVDTETMVNCASAIDDYSIIFEIDRIESILSYVREEIRDNCAQVIDMLILGYNYNEIAHNMDVNIKSVYKYVSAIVNALAIADALDKEWNALDKIIAQDVSFKDTISRRMLEKAIISEYKKAFPKHDNMVIDWQYALDRLKASAYYTANQKSLSEMFYK